MLKFSPKSLIILLNFFVISCSGALRESPVIYLSNASSGNVTNVEVNWAGKKTLFLPALNPGESSGQSFYMNRDSDFFGSITVSWYNMRGEKMVQTFDMRRENLPSISRARDHNYVQIYFGQEDFEVVSSDSPNLRGKVRRMEILMKQYSEAHRYNQLYGAMQPSRSPYFTLSQN